MDTFENQECVRAGCFHKLREHDFALICRVNGCECGAFIETRETNAPTRKDGPVKPLSVEDGTGEHKCDCWIRERQVCDICQGVDSQTAAVPVAIPSIPPSAAVPVEEGTATGHEFSTPDGELDEVFIKNASVHIERMDDMCFWIGIDSPGKHSLHICTGVEDGAWWFSVEEDALSEGKYLKVERTITPPVPERTAEMQELMGRLRAGAEAVIAWKKIEEPASLAPLFDFAELNTPENILKLLDHIEGKAK